MYPSWTDFHYVFVLGPTGCKTQKCDSSIVFRRLLFLLSFLILGLARNHFFFFCINSENIPANQTNRGGTRKFSWWDLILPSNFEEVAEFKTEFMKNKKVWHLRFDVTPPFPYYGNSHLWTMSVSHPFLKEIIYDSHIQNKSTILRNKLTNPTE